MSCGRRSQDGESKRRQIHGRKNGEERKEKKKMKRRKEPSFVLSIPSRHYPVLVSTKYELLRIAHSQTNKKGL